MLCIYWSTVNGTVGSTLQSLEQHMYVLHAAEYTEVTGAEAHLLLGSILCIVHLSRQQQCHGTNHSYPMYESTDV